MDKAEHVSISMTPMNLSDNTVLSREGRNIELVDDAEPFLPSAEKIPPLANPEHDSDEATDTEMHLTPETRPGIDDGFFLTDIDEKAPPLPEKPNGIGPRIGGTDEIDADNPDLQPTFPGVVTINGVQTVVPDVNVYQHKKTLAQGMMDLALLSANANQLRYVLESYNRHPYYYASLIFIVTSLLFQIAVGVGLILNSRYNVKDKKEICHANRINNLTVIGIFIVTVVNVFISAFGVADPPPDLNA